jgi:HSP20 family protein
LQDSCDHFGHDRCIFSGRIEITDASSASEGQIGEQRDAPDTQEEEMTLPTRRRSTTVFRPFPELRWDADRLLDDMFSRPRFTMAPGGPEADFYETENDFVLEMDLPGFTNEDVDVTVEKGVLSISGERTSEREEAVGTYHLRERTWGKFSRSFSIPHTIEAEEVDAQFKKGVLTVKLPKAAEAMARKIQITGE